MSRAGDFTAAQIEAVLGIPPSTLRVWVHRGHVRKVARDLYDGDSVIARWRARQDDDGAKGVPA